MTAGRVKTPMADKRIVSDKIEKEAERIMGALGLAQRARALTCGRELCIEQMKKEKAVLAVFPNDISENAKKELLHSFDKSGTPYIALPVSMAVLSARLGKTSSVSCAVITDKNLADIIYRLLGFDMSEIPETTHD